MSDERTAREVAELSIRLMRNTPDHDVYLDEFTAALEARDAEHKRERIEAIAGVTVTAIDGVGGVLQQRIAELTDQLSAERDTSKRLREALERAESRPRSLGDVSIDVDIQALHELDQLDIELREATELLRTVDGRHCGYDVASAKCPMVSPCWHHRRNAWLAARSQHSQPHREERRR